MSITNILLFLWHGQHCQDGGINSERVREIKREKADVVMSCYVSPLCRCYMAVNQKQHKCRYESELMSSWLVLQSASCAFATAEIHTHTHPHVCLSLLRFWNKSCSFCFVLLYGDQTNGPTSSKLSDIPVLVGTFGPHQDIKTFPDHVHTGIGMKLQLPECSTAYEHGRQGLQRTAIADTCCVPVRLLSVLNRIRD